VTVVVRDFHLSVSNADNTFNISMPNIGYFTENFKQPPSTT